MRCLISGEICSFPKTKGWGDPDSNPVFDMGAEQTVVGIIWRTEKDKARIKPVEVSIDPFPIRGRYVRTINCLGTFAIVY